MVLLKIQLMQRNQENGRVALVVLYTSNMQISYNHYFYQVQTR